MIAISAAALIGSGCGSGGSTGTGQQRSTGDQQSPQSISTQPEPPCERVPDALVQQVTKRIDDNTMTLEGVWQMVPAKHLHELGLDDPVFVSARVTVDKNPTTYATWTTQDAKDSPVIPLDGSAKAGTKPDAGLDATKYNGLVTNRYYVKSRECAQAAFGLEEQKHQLKKEQSRG